MADAVDSFSKLRQLGTRIGEQRDADVLWYNGGVSRANSDRVIELCEARARRDRVLLILTTSGGNPHAAYRIARCLQQHYTHFVAFVPGYCKSAGTLLVLGAHELVMSPHAELGPLDIQVSREDEVGEQSSVLTPTDALRVLQSQAIGAAVSSFRELRFKSKLPTKLAAEIASNLVGSLYSQIFAQIDPMRLGELERATRIAAEYGKRLIKTGQNATERSLLELVGGYPSHGFCIDIDEARNLFEKVTDATPLELELSVRDPIIEDDAIVVFLNEAKARISDEKPSTADGRATSGAGTAEVKADRQADGAPGGQQPDVGDSGSPTTN